MTILLLSSIGERPSVSLGRKINPLQQRLHLSANNVTYIVEGNKHSIKSERFEGVYWKH